MQAVVRLLRGLPWSIELLIVILVAFGEFAWTSIEFAITPEEIPAETEGELWDLVAVELAIMAVLGPFLWLRGWTLHRVGFDVHRNDIPAGLGLFAGAWVASSAAVMLALSLFGDDVFAGPYDVDVGEDLSIASILALCIVNSIFEEVFLTGYLITCLRERVSVWPAIHASVALRLLGHLYQGAAGVAGVIPFGFLFAIWFARTGRLWPLVIAHGVHNFWVSMFAPA